MIIGINGKPGSGKTTVSNLVLYGYNKEIIHLDYVFNGIKKKYLKKISVYGKTLNGEDKIYLDRESSLKKILETKYIKDLYNLSKNAYAHVLIKNKIRKSKADYIILEGINLTNYNLDRICDALILVKADNKLRYERVLKRDVYEDRESIINFLNNDNKNIIDEHGYYIIENNNNLDNLSQSVKELSNKIKYLSK